jgi:hypothetical protein
LSFFFNHMSLLPTCENTAKAPANQERNQRRDAVWPELRVFGFINWSSKPWHFSGSLPSLTIPTFCIGGPVTKYAPGDAPGVKGSGLGWTDRAERPS